MQQCNVILNIKLYIHVPIQLYTASLNTASQTILHHDGHHTLHHCTLNITTCVQKVTTVHFSSSQKCDCLKRADTCTQDPKNLKVCRLFALVFDVKTAVYAKMNSASLTKSKQNTIIEPMYSTYMYMLASHYQASKTPQWLNSLTLFPNLMDPCPIVHAHCNMEGSQGNEGRFYCHIQLQRWFLGQEGKWESQAVTYNVFFQGPHLGFCHFAVLQETESYVYSVGRVSLVPKHGMRLR